MFKNQSPIYLLAIMIIAGAALFCYEHTFEAPFVFDDHLQIVDNPKIKNLDYQLSLERLTSKRPLVNLTFALNYHLHKLDVTGYHMVNLFIHILSGVVVFFLTLMVLKLLDQRKSIFSSKAELTVLYLVALFAALVFIVHPLQTQAVTYIVQRYTSMAALFYLLSVFFYVLARIRQNRNDYIGTYLFFFCLCLVSGILAFLAKQSTASLPLAILLMELLLFDRDLQTWKRNLFWIVPIFSLFLAFVFYNTGLLSKNFDLGSLLEDVSSLMQDAVSVGRLEYLYTQFNVIPNYLKLFVLPVGLNVDPMYPFAKNFLDGYTPFGFAFLLSLAIAAAWCIKRFPVISLGVFWFFITLSVESSIIPIRDAMFEHRMYLPILGPSLVLAWALGLAGRKWPVLALVLGLLVISTLGFLTYERNKVWTSNQALWTDTLSKNQNNYRAHTNLGLSLELQGEKFKALDHYNQALALEPDFAFAHLNKGSLLGQMGQPREAEYHFRRALETSPRNPKVLNNLGASLASQGELQEALKFFQKAVRLNPYFIEARFNLALTLVNLQKNDQARDELKQLLDLEPKNEAAKDLWQWLENR